MTASKRKRRCLIGAKDFIKKDSMDGKCSDFSEFVFNFGDISWVRTGSSSWWPAQVTDEKIVGPHLKPTKKEEHEVLVRLYGTYSYMYVDPAKNNEEFENVIRKSKNNVAEMLEKALEKELSCIKRWHKTKECPDLCNDNIKKLDKVSNAESGNRILKENMNCLQSATGLIRDVRRQQVRQKNRVGSVANMKQKEDGESGSNHLTRLDRTDIEDPGSQKLKKKNKRQLVIEQCRNETLMNFHKDGIREQPMKEKTGYQIKCKQTENLKSQQDASLPEFYDLKETKLKGKPIKKKRKLMAKTQLQLARCGNEMQGSDKKRKCKDVSKHGKVVDVRGHVKHAPSLLQPVGKACSASARRIKVMQSLALIAPPNSPYC